MRMFSICDFSCVTTLDAYGNTDLIITGCHERSLPGQQPVLGGSDQFREVFSGGSQFLYLVLHSGQDLRGEEKANRGIRFASAVFDD